jgi:hypothetical protein
MNLACINAQNGELPTPHITGQNHISEKMTGGHKNS